MKQIVAKEVKIAVKEVNFNNVNMLALENENGVFVSIKSICNGLGVDSNGQAQRIKRDETLVEGLFKMQVPTNSGIQETNMLNIEYLPLWISGFTISQVNEESKQILKEFKLKAKDVLAEAFLNKKHRVPQNMKEALLIALEQQEEIERLELENSMQKQEIETNKPKVDYYNTILADTTSLLSVTQIAKDYNLTAVALNKILKENKIQYKQSSQWLLCAEHLNKGFVKSVTHLVDGRPFLNTKWTQRGRIFIHELLSKLGIKAVMDTQETTF